MTGLVRLFPNAHADTTGGTQTHPYTKNHYVTPDHLANLNTLADRFFAKFGVKIKYNDSSLPLGGLFDVGTGAWYYPHKAHRMGQNTDLKTQGMTEAMLNFVEQQWVDQLKGDFCDETVNEDGTPNTTSPHYHLIYPGKC